MLLPWGHNQGTYQRGQGALPGDIQRDQGALQGTYQRGQGALPGDILTKGVRVCFKAVSFSS